MGAGLEMGRTGDDDDLALDAVAVGVAGYLLEPGDALEGALVGDGGDELLAQGVEAALRDGGG